MAKDSIRIALLLQGEYINKYAANAIEKVIDQTSAEVSLVVINENTTKVTQEKVLNPVPWVYKILDLIKEHKFWAPYVIKRSIDPPEYAKSVHISMVDGLEAAEKIYTSPKDTSGLGNELPTDVVNKISSHSDIGIRFGFGIIKGDVLKAPHYGILSFHHGDIRKYRGRAGGFWAYLKGDQEAGITLQRLNEDLDGGEIVVFKSVNISDAPTLGVVKERIFGASEDMLVTAIKDIEKDEFSATKPENLGDLYTNRNLFQVMRVFSKDIIGVVRNKYFRQN